MAVGSHEDAGDAGRRDVGLVAPWLAERLADAIVWDVPVPMGVVDTELRHILANRALAALYGVDRSAVVGATHTELLGPSGHDIGMRCRTAILAGRPELGHLIDASIPGRGGTAHWQLDCIPLMQQRRARALLLVVTDLTARTRAMRSLNEQRRKLAHQATHDPLTGLGNRQGLVDALDARLRGSAPPELLLIDLDGFKAVNDRYGHAAGDHVLQVVAERLLAAVRRSEMVARHGGDEFVVVLPPGARAEIVAPRLAAALRDPIKWEDELLWVRASIGEAVGDPDDTPASLLERADRDMYRQKAMRRARADDATGQARGQGTS